MSLFQFGFKKSETGKSPPSQKLYSPQQTKSKTKQQSPSKSLARRSPRKKSSSAELKRKAEEGAIVVDDSSSDAVEIIDPPKAESKRRKVEKPVEDVNKKRTVAPLVSSESGEKKRLLLAGEVVVVTGILNEFDREEFFDFARRLGARVTTGVSSKTTILVTGYVLENGNEVHTSNKYKNAVEKNAAKKAKGGKAKLCQILTEEEFVSKYGKTVAPLQQPSPAKSMPQGQKPKMREKSPKRAAAEDSMLWADKYKPKCLNDLVANTSAVRQLGEWLKRWEDVHVSKKFRPKFTKQNPGAKAALLSGPPGIGKSSAAALVAMTQGYDVMETNASDSRSKKLVQAVLGAAVTNRTIAGGPGKKRLIIMDEVDGMSSSDRGGNQELIQCIKKSKVPIICICNDRQKSSVRSLANHCYDLKFYKPRKDMLLKRMLQIGQKEGMAVEPNALEMLIDASNGDVRQVLGMMQMWKKSSRSITYDQAKARQNVTKKDAVLGIDHSQAVQFMFKNAGAEKTFHARFDAFFVNYDLIPLLVQQFYPTTIQSNTGRLGAHKTLENLSKAADAACDADIATKYVRARQEWQLLPTTAALNLRVASFAPGFIPFAGFPEWLGKNSNINKRRRLCHELSMHMRQFATISPHTLRLDYMTPLKRSLLKPLLDQGKGGVKETLELMESYGISRDDFFETIQEIKFARDANEFERLNAQTKREFTRLYNTMSHKSQLLARENAIVGLKKKKSKKTSGDAEESDQDSDAEDVAALLKSKAKSKSKAKGKNKRKAGTLSQKGKRKKAR